MNKKMTYGIILVLFISLIFLGSNMENDVMVDSEYDDAFYVENSDNLFIKLAKVLDKCCYFAVDIIISGINTIFEVILGS